MNLLLDTHTFLWWMAIKKSLGKLGMPDDVEAALEKAGFRPLPIGISHALLAGQLPRHHDDPFDRLLIAQAQTEGLTVVTRDERFQAYGVSLLKA